MFNPVIPNDQDFTFTDSAEDFISVTKVGDESGDYIHCETFSFSDGLIEFTIPQAREFAYRILDLTDPYVE